MNPRIAPVVPGTRPELAQIEAAMRVRRIDVVQYASPSPSSGQIKASKPGKTLKKMFLVKL